MTKVLKVRRSPSLETADHEDWSDWEDFDSVDADWLVGWVTEFVEAEVQVIPDGIYAKFDSYGRPQMKAIYIRRFGDWYVADGRGQWALAEVDDEDVKGADYQLAVPINGHAQPAPKTDAPADPAEELVLNTGKNGLYVRHVQSAGEDILDVHGCPDGDLYYRVNGNWYFSATKWLACNGVTDKIVSECPYVRYESTVEGL